YNPLLPNDSAERVVLREERVRYWLDQGAKPSDRVARFLDGAGITSNTVKHRGTGKRAQEIEAKKAAAAAEAAGA
ncbi:MAG TPA: 30S ribosomal protein S16, partial [Geminicoccaceae bacterium]|nr:30S ribosomal protein S16 [Geminicoccaceae bacterium]